MPCLEPSGAGGMRTMLTDIAHPPLQGLGQGVLGEAHLVVGHGVRVEGDQDLPVHEGDLLPVQEHLAVLLPVPDPEKGHGALAAADEDVIEDLRQERLHKGRIEAIYKGQDPDALGVLMEAHPANVLDDLKMARALYKHVCHLFDESKAGVRIEGGYGGSLLDLAAREAVKMADYHAGVKDADERDVRDRAEKLLDALPGIPDDAFLDDMEFTVRQLKSLVEWLARQAGIPPETGTADGSFIPPEEQLLEIVHTEARYEVVRLEGAAEEVQAQILKKRRERVLPDQADLQTVSRYEAHLSRQMYQALHELEALQTRRGGKAAPLARLDVQS